MRTTESSPTATAENLLHSIVRRQALLLALILTTGLTSCGLISINDSGYKQLSDEEKKHVVRRSRPIDSLTYDGNIYQVDVGQTSDYLKRHDDVIIYEYAAYCHSELCINPKAAERMCHDHGYGFCLIISTYDYLDRLPEMGVPVLAIYQKPYNTDKVTKYCAMFYDELTGVSEKTRGYGRYYHFRKGKFIKAYDNINDAFTHESADSAINTADAAIRLHHYSL